MQSVNVLVFFFLISNNNLPVFQNKNWKKKKICLPLFSDFLKKDYVTDNTGIKKKLVDLTKTGKTYTYMYLYFLEDFNSSDILI